MRLTTKQVVGALGLLAFLALWSNLKLLPTSSLSEPPAEPFLPVTSINVSDSGSLNVNIHDASPNKMIHLAIFGLGHRLIRTSTAWHLAQRLGVSQFKFNWGTCGKDHSSGPRIFSYLFGTDEWAVPHLPSNNATATPPHRGRNILVRNDVYGYMPAQTFQDHRIPLNETLYKDAVGPFLSKINSDVDFFKKLQKSFVFRDRVDQFMRENKFQDHTVIGLHLRAGNGEETHFSYSGRHIANETTFVTNLVDLIHRFLVVDGSKSWSKGEALPAKPPLIFLATDTAYLVPTFVNLTQRYGIKSVVLPQIRVPDRQGVTFSALRGAGEKCLLGWQAMVADMLLLSEADVLVAARHSSFTQSIPISLVLDRNKNQRGPHFCEVSNNATSMSCLQDLPTWLYRDNLAREWVYSLPLSDTDQADQVRHKALIHLPDIAPPEDYDHLLKFLEEMDLPPLEDGGIPTHTYGGQRFNPKYRNRKRAEIPGWNFISDLDI
jgi:hypothetical protein